MSIYLSLGLDILVLAGLGVTIYYCLHLSKSLNTFRQSREEFYKIVEELNQSIETAEIAIQGMKEAAKTSGEDLQRVIDRSKGLSDELSLMNESGDNLAQRLEKIASTSRRVAQGLPDEQSSVDPDSFIDDDPVISEQLKKESDFLRGKGAAPFPQKEKPAPQKPKEPSFFIKDRDYGANDKTLDDFLGANDEDEPAEFESQAERELYEALQKNKKNTVL